MIPQAQHHPGTITHQHGELTGDPPNGAAVDVMYEAVANEAPTIRTPQPVIPSNRGNASRIIPSKPGDPCILSVLLWPNGQKELRLHVFESHYFEEACPK